MVLNVLRHLSFILLIMVKNIYTSIRKDDRNSNVLTYNTTTGEINFTSDLVVRYTPIFSTDTISLDCKNSSFVNACGESSNRTISTIALTNVPTNGGQVIITLDDTGIGGDITISQSLAVTMNGGSQTIRNNISSNLEIGTEKNAVISIVISPEISPGNNIITTSVDLYS